MRRDFYISEVATPGGKRRWFAFCSGPRQGAGIGHDAPLRKSYASARADGEKWTGEREK